MLSDEEDSPEKYRERRRTRFEMNTSAVSPAGGSSSPSGQGTLSRASSGSGQQPEMNVPDFLVPVVGVMSVAGRLRGMEDSVTVRTNLCLPRINGNRPIHFFAVYDGEGGQHVSAVCRAYMHALLEDEVMRAMANTARNASSSSTSPPELANEQMQKETEDVWKRVLKNCFQRMDEIETGGMTRYCTGEDKYRCMPGDVVLSGSTAVVVILTQEHIIVANCGDSRAVLCRGPKAIPLSDHKLDRADASARIEASGGRITYSNGARVQGILTKTTAIGDKYLKPFVTSEPEILFMKRDRDQDVCLILASDGLWDVLSIQMACHVARECLKTPTGSGPDFAIPGASVAATLLTRLALGRRSLDNISVIVVDLKREERGG